MSTSFRIQASKPTAPADLKAVLESARDAWLDNTPDPADTASADLYEKIEEARSSGAKAEIVSKLVAEAVQRWRDSVKAFNRSTPGPTHAGALGLINIGIEACVTKATKMGVKVRASVHGHFEIPADGIAHRPRQRLCDEVDIAE